VIILMILKSKFGGSATNGTQLIQAHTTYVSCGNGYFLQQDN